MRESVTSQVLHSHSHMSGSHSMMSHDKSHDRCGKEVHRLCSSCISSVEKSNRNSIKFSLSNTDKGAVSLILALELASLTVLRCSQLFPSSNIVKRSCKKNCSPFDGNTKYILPITLACLLGCHGLALTF